MNVAIKKWGNSLGLQIPPNIAQSFGLDENSIVEITESKTALVITKKKNIPSLDELLQSIPDDFHYPEDVLDFAESEPQGQEII
jgi:antitoxin MazE